MSETPAAGTPAPDPKDSLTPASVPPPMDPALVQTLRASGEGRVVFGRFKLLRELGRGGMGVVWLAHDERLAMEVALKFLPGMVATDTDALQDLRKEITRGLQLTHPGIVRVYDLHEDAAEGLAGIAMEYVAGATLADEKARQPNRCFDADALTGWVRQLCEVLAYVHEEARIVHRDLKPRNLMLTPTGRLKVTDFGIAATLSDSQSRLTNLNTSGTPSYMSPQQATGYRPMAGDDIYALGATLYELLTSKPPFFRGAAVSILHQLLHEPVSSMTERREEFEIKGRASIPPNWEETILACLSKEPSGRPASMREVSERLLNPGAHIVPPLVESSPDEDVTVRVTHKAPEPSRPSDMWGASATPPGTEKRPSTTGSTPRPATTGGTSRPSQREPVDPVQYVPPEPIRYVPPEPVRQTEPQFEPEPRHFTEPVQPPSPVPEPRTATQTHPSLQPQPPVRFANVQQNRGQPVADYLFWSILVTVACCPPFGIVAIIAAANANSRKLAGDYDGARASAASAKMWCLIAMGVGFTIEAIYAIYIIATLFLAASNSN